LAEMIPLTAKTGLQAAIYAAGLDEIANERGKRVSPSRTQSILYNARQ